jgi:hypothetical protein
MKKLFLRLSLFIVPVILGLIGVEFMIRRIPNDYSYKNNYLEKHAGDIQVLILGSSHTFFGINPEEMNEKAFNAAYVSQTLKYDYAILQRISAEANQLKCIVIPVDYFSLYDKLVNDVEKWRIKNYNLYYGMHDTYDPVNYLEIANGKQVVNVWRIYNYYKNGQSNITCNALGWGTDYLSSKGKDLAVSGIDAANRHTAKDSLSIPGNIAVLNNIFAFAKSKRIKVILVTAPAYQTYTEKLDPAQLNRTISLAKEMVDRNPEVSYFNLLNDASFKAGDFYDADHVNEKGALKFTRKVDSLIAISKLRY